MTTETTICNMALDRIGHNRPIVNINDDATAEADLLRRHYGPSRDSILRAHPWNFAIKRANLAQDATAPTFEYDYRFVLPNDCLKVLRTSLEADDIKDDYRIEGRYLLSGDDTVKIEYIARITDVAQFDVLFIDILAQRLAAECAMPLINDAKIADVAMRSYQMKLMEARSVDAQEGTPRQVITGYDWLNVRY